MVRREGERVYCKLCGANRHCVGTIDSYHDWYGKQVVTVYFDAPRWDECEREVFYTEDLKPVTKAAGS